MLSIPGESPHTHHPAEAAALEALGPALPFKVEIPPPREAHPAPDLRKRLRREFTARLLERAVWLPTPDRTLIEAVYRDHKKVADIARLLDADPRLLRRRVRSIARRVLSNKFMFVVGRLIDSNPTRPAHAQEADDEPRKPVRRWSHERRRVAEECILNGRSIREAARALHLSLYAVRTHRQAVDVIFSSEESRRSL